MGNAGRAMGEVLAERFHQLRREGGVLRAVGHERLAGELLRPEGDRLLRLGDAGHVRLDHDELGELAHAGLVRRVGEGRVVGGAFRFGHVRLPAAHQLSDREVRRLRHVRPPGEEAFARRLPRREGGVHEHDPVEALAHAGCHRQGQPEQAAPVLDHQGDFLQIELFDQAQQRVAMKVEGVVVVRHRLVRAAEPEEVRRHHPRPRGKKDGDHLAVEEAPGGLAVQAEEGVSRVLRALVDPRHAQAGEARQVGLVLRRVGEVRQAGEAIVRRAHALQRGAHCAHIVAII